jgi:WD40-like Beta Propeller Repeat
VSSRIVRIALFAVVAALGLLAPAAHADVFGAATMLSASPFGQAEYGHDPALSEDGRYVVFDGSIAGVHGIWRRSTAPGANFEQVAGGDATLPSVSSDGRYISFTTNEGASLPALTDGAIHEVGAAQEAPSVYVRDMAIGAGEPGAFTLVSAKDHSTESLAYEFPGADESELEADLKERGAVAAARSAITADGRTVAFVTTAQSDLAGPETPPMQVAVRHLDSDVTELVSVRFDPSTGRPAVNGETGALEPVPEEEGRFGAVWADGQVPTFTLSEGTITRPYLPAELPGAAISADGSAVAWYGGQISEQARTLSAEQLVKQYAEPLWRRIANGPGEPTRRVTGGSDPESPGCLAHPESQLPFSAQAGDPCQGPFAVQRTGAVGLWNGGTPSDFVPRLSANGNYVAFLASAPLTSEGEAFGIGGEQFNSDVYREDMTAPDRTSGLLRLTQYASGDVERGTTNANVRDLAISPDGMQIAFTTRRTVFPLGAPAFVSTQAAVPGLVELYDADLGDETLTRVTTGYEDGPPEHPELESGNEDRYARRSDGSLSPSFDASGTLLSFSSTASNLVFGDGNSPPNAQSGRVDGADVFIVPRIVFDDEPTPQVISPAPRNPSLQAPWRLEVSASSLASGAVQIKAKVPAAGVLAASAASTVPAKSARAHGGSRRTVAKASAPAHGATATVALKLQLGGRYRGLAFRAGGLTSKVTVTFASKGHPTLRRTLTIRFVHRGSHKRAKARRNR